MRNKLLILSRLLFLTIAVILLSILLITGCTPSLPMSPPSPVTQPASPVPMPPTVVGNLWQKLNVPSCGEARDIKFINADTGVVLGADPSLRFNIILKTFDGGNTWDTIQLATNSFFNNYLLVDIYQSPFNENLLFAATNINLFRSIDGGHHWSKIDSVNKRSSPVMYFFDAATAACSSGVGMSRTIDSGLTWIEVFHPQPSTGFSHIQFTSNSTGYISGGGGADGGNTGMFAKTSDAGINWQLSNYPFHNILAMSFLDNNTGYISMDMDSVTSTYNDYILGCAIYKTTDGAISWQPVSKAIWDSTGGGYAYQLYFKNASEGFMSGNTGIFHTLDGGKNWVREYPTSTLFSFPDQHTGFAVDVKTGHVYKRQF